MSTKSDLNNNTNSDLKEKRNIINNVTVYSNKNSTKYNLFEKKRCNSLKNKQSNEKSLNITHNSNKSNHSKNSNGSIQVITSISSLKNKQRIKMENRFKDSPISKIFQNSVKIDNVQRHVNHFKIIK